MWKQSNVFARWGAAMALICVAVAVGPNYAEGADHFDSPAVSADPLSDIGDFYAWMSADAANLNMIITASPFATAENVFSDAIQYVFHVGSRADFGAADEDDSRVVCQFYDTNGLECWAFGDDGAVVDYVAGDPSNTAGIVSDSGNIRVFAGLRDDPFFFNLDGFNRTIDTVRAAAGGLSFDEGNCPTVDGGTSAELVRQLTTDADDGAATDDLRDANILALVVQVDKSLLTSGGPILAAWGSAHQAE